MGKNAKLKEKQKWSYEKLHLENARKLRGIYFIDPEDKEFKEAIKNARKKLETPIAPAMPCKILKNNKNCGSGTSNKVKSRLACVLEASEYKTAWENHYRLIMFFLTDTAFYITNTTLRHQLMGPTPRGDGHPQPPNWEECRHPLLGRISGLTRKRPQPWPLRKTRWLPTSFATPVLPVFGTI